MPAPELRPNGTSAPAHADSVDWELVAYRTHVRAPAIIPAPVKRNWMSDTPAAFATRCLPMLIANQSGWFLLNTQRVSLEWNGGVHKSDLTITYAEEASSPRWVVSCFGNGIVTWTIPILFRVRENFNLWVRGPSNLPKAAIYPLEGIVEADWSVATFTMNWQLTSPGMPVVFEQDEPFCMIVPIRRGDVERFAPVSAPIDTNAALDARYQEWCRVRHEFRAVRETNEFQLDYTRGRIGDQRATSHQTRLRVRPFRALEQKREPDFG